MAASEPNESPERAADDNPAEKEAAVTDAGSGAAVTAGADVEEAVAAPSARGAELEGPNQAPKQEVDEASGPTKPSYTLKVRGLPEDVELDVFETLLAREGTVVSVHREDDVVIAKFQRTTEAFKAREKLNGSDKFGAPLEVEFGPQDADHYCRDKKAKGRKSVLDGDDPSGAGSGMKKVGGTRAWRDIDGGAKPGDGADDAAGPPAKKKKVDDDRVPPLPAKARPPVTLDIPARPVSKWSYDLTFEEQLEDFMKMPRRGMYNRYVVLGKLPPELRTGEAIWRTMQPVQRDIIQIEMLTCFGKPVSHVTLRSATAAAAMHRLCEQMHQGLTVAFAPPRKASASLWLGNVDDFVPRAELETRLGEFSGKAFHELRYLPARTCAFAKFSDAESAIRARNYLYGLEVQKNQYLNVDFVDDGEQGWSNDAWGGWNAMPWAQPWDPRGGWTNPWQQPPPGREPWRREEAGWNVPPPPPPGPRGPRSPPRYDRGRRDGRRSRSRSRSRGRYSEPEESPPMVKPKKSKKIAAEKPAKVKKQDVHSDSEAGGMPTKKQTKSSTKAKVKLYKMGEFCCNIVANYVKGKESPEPLQIKLQIDQRTKIDHCRSHLERAGALATVWHFSAADRRDCAAYDALCDYFVEKQRVGLVVAPSYYVYIVPPTEKYLAELGLPNSNFVVGLQIPIKK